MAFQGQKQRIAIYEYGVSYLIEERSCTWELVLNEDNNGLPVSPEVSDHQFYSSVVLENSLQFDLRASSAPARHPCDFYRTN